MWQLDLIKPGKINIIIDGQFGSTGKGLIAQKIYVDNHIDVAIGSLSPNAGHTFYDNDEKKRVTKLLPVAGILDKRNQIYLSADSVIDEDILFREIEEFNIDPCRLMIHPRASVVDKTHPEESLVTIASTQSGSGYARASKLMRTNKLAQGSERLKEFVGVLDLEYYLKQKLHVLVETGQGIDLGINHGLSYPYCTSRDVLPATVLSELGLHPTYLGNVMLIFRTYPIRVGNPVKDGVELGFSGPVYPDSKEISWQDLSIEPELTTVTKRIRRVFTFSDIQYKRSIEMVKPSHIFLNFCNYLNETTVETFEKLKPHPTCYGFGSRHYQIYPYERGMLRNYVYKWR